MPLVQAVIVGFIPHDQLNTEEAQTFALQEIGIQCWRTACSTGHACKAC